MYRRELLKSACAGTASLIGATTSAAAISTANSEYPGVAWQRVYDELKIASVAPAHDSGQIFVGRGRGRSDPEVPVRIALIDGEGTIRQRREIDRNISEDARRANADVIRTENGYAVATGSWFARLDEDLSVEATGFAAEYKPNSTTYLTELSNGVAVAAEIDAPNHVSLRVFGFDYDGDLQWTRKYGEQNSKWLAFLIEGHDGGLVVGDREPWLARLADDGTERWQTTVTGVPTGVGSDATSDDDGFTLFGESSMVRLTESRSVKWHRTYDSFEDTFDGKITRTIDGGYAIAAQDGLDRVRVGRTDAKGRLQWSHEYEVIEVGDAYVNDIVERAPGEYLVVGSRRDVQQGWALLLSEEETPTTKTSPSTQTRTTSQKTTAFTTTSPTKKPTSTTVPGFSVGAALFGTAAGLLVRGRR